ncbi:related to Y.lipolytica GPR1 protein and Fun34p [Ramularia collo-cygni]|uniref:Related to Y.lipolytica GPR1 protein and Fun34p n=1 Tax=Ramularia collo-cygni TaxID=112498 RepID=A0A2D3URU6_9PEZI|nr:related to Y.lipolytica GPR1 protein and Fun34p [Ramularia collo-cygni]CZT14237.1 related to Y.lipolytica GPR1 protein and Fun34p [Ramularia collo-cygni]
MDTHQDIGKDFHPGADFHPEDVLRQINTNATGSVTISSELFERLYLQPKVADPAGLKHPLQKLFGNPTGLAIIGFEMSLMPISMQLMGWRGAGGSRATNNANVIFFGGVLMWVGGLLEFVLGNTFPFLVFTSFGSFYAGYGGTMMPEFATYAPFSDDPLNDPLAGIASAEWNANYGLWWVAFTILMFFYWLCSLRTNVVYALMFTTIFPGVACVAAVFIYAADANAQKAHDCQVAAGALLFCACVFGWYLFAALILPTVDFPLYIPLGDLTHVVPSLTQRNSGGGRRLRKPRSGSEKIQEDGGQV